MDAWENSTYYNCEIRWEGLDQKGKKPSDQNWLQLGTQNLNINALIFFESESNVISDGLSRYFFFLTGKKELLKKISTVMDSCQTTLILAF